MAEHKFQICNCMEPGCVVCEGGLAICTICGLTEGCLTTDCPGEQVFASKSDAVYAGEIDFRNGEWVKEHSPFAPCEYAIYYVWPDGTYVSAEDYVEEEWTWMSDDYARTAIPSYISEDHPDFDKLIERALHV